MKSPLLLLSLFLSLLLGRAAAADFASPNEPLTADQIEELVSPIALYPDPLVALILPASTFPSDVVLAAPFVQSKEDPALVDEKPWDESIRWLTRYPDLLTWIDANLEWPTQLGYAYLA